ncbi:MAG: hypothetical protein EPN99_15840 [Frankiales bacterium]|nr:MAG: hypothetical protein EPN99_15840 [Frankiales bacterium]
MYARTTTVQGNPAHVDDGIALVRDEVMPALQSMEGCIGVSMLVDRESGGAIVTSSWESREAMRATEAAVAPLRDRAQQVLGGRPEVKEWDIAVLHRARPIPEGACARVTWTRIDPTVLDPMLDYFRMNVLPEIEQLPGFCSASLLVDRSTGLGALAAVYDSAEALEASRDAASMLRSEATDKMEAELIDVASFEVALAHLRVPETV